MQIVNNRDLHVIQLNWNEHVPCVHFIFRHLMKSVTFGFEFQCFYFWVKMNFSIFSPFIITSIKTLKETKTLKEFSRWNDEMVEILMETNKILIPHIVRQIEKKNF